MAQLADGPRQKYAQLSMANPTALLETSLGNVKVELFTDQMPLTAQNFVKLAKSGFLRRAALSPRHRRGSCSSSAAHTAVTRKEPARRHG